MRRTDVLVVGGGPTGLTAANVLARQGADHLVVERDPGPIDESRALWVHTRTLELWDKLGLLGDALRRGRVTDRIDLLVEGRPRGHIPYRAEGRSPFPWGLVLEQSSTQRMLVDGLGAAGGGVRWATTVERIERTDGGVVATLRTAGGTVQRVHARYLVGADGGASTVRGAGGFAFPGSTYPTAFFVADVDLDTALDHGRVHFDLTREHFFAFVPMEAAGRFRLIGSLTPELEQRFGGERRAGTTVAIDVAAIQAHLDRHAGVPARVVAAHWTSVYRVHQRMADRFRDGPVFLAGDAAHLHSPTAGQGMNTGIGDAFNLAWKLGEVVRGEAPERLLDSYEPERMPAARRVLAVSDRIFSIEAATGPVMQRLKPVIITALSAFFARTRTGANWIFGYLSQLDIAYRDSPAVTDAVGTGSLRAGDRLPYAPLRDGSHTHALIAGIDHRLLLAGVEDDALVTRHARLVAGHGLPAPRVVPPAETAALRALGAAAPTALLVRPDGHVGHRGPAGDLDGLRAHLAAVRTGSDAPVA